MTDPNSTSAAETRSRRDTARLAGLGLIGILIVLFAVLNFDEVKVNWVLGTWSTPLIIVIVVSFLLGVAADRLLLLRQRRGRRASS